MKTYLTTLLIVILLITAGCNKQENLPVNEENTAPKLTLDASKLEAFRQHYSETLQKNLDASTLATLLLHDSIKQFLTTPDTENLEAAKQKWLDCYTAFNNTKPFTILTDKPTQPSYIDTWPMLPGYIDAIAGFPNSGIVNDLSLELNEATIRQQHGLTFPGEISTGFHALEFMLWGENPAASDSATTQEVQHLERYKPVKQWDQPELDVSQLSNNRRRQYLSLISRMLVKDLEQTNAEAKAAWQANPHLQTMFQALYKKTGETRAHLSQFNGNLSEATTFSASVHNDLRKHTRLISELLKPLTGIEQGLPKDIRSNLLHTLVEIEKTINELSDIRNDIELWDKLDFNLSQLESLLFTLASASYTTAMPASNSTISKEALHKP